MKLKKVSLLLPYNKNLEILFQNRKGFHTKYTKDYGFFGGHLEEGETIEQALYREIMEELELDVKHLEDLEFFKQFIFKMPELDKIAELNVFLCKMPDLTNLKVNEGTAEVFKIAEIFEKNISEYDKQMLKEIENYIKLK